MHFNHTQWHISDLFRSICYESFVWLEFFIGHFFDFHRIKWFYDYYVGNQFKWAIISLFKSFSVNLITKIVMANPNGPMKKIEWIHLEKKEKTNIKTRNMMNLLVIITERSNWIIIKITQIDKSRIKVLIPDLRCAVCW